MPAQAKSHRFAHLRGGQTCPPRRCTWGQTLCFFHLPIDNPSSIINLIMRLKLLLIVSVILLFHSPAFCADIKSADLSGSWYPDNARQLSGQIKAYLNAANPPDLGGELVAIISPHAGIQYSGPIAAFGFKLAQKKKIATVIVVGFSHRKDYDGIAIFDADGIKTPLGILFTDKKLTHQLINSNKKIFSFPEAFSEENSIELILPFIQVSLDNPRIVLLAIGRQTQSNYQLLSESLFYALKGQKDFLLVASTDMSHFLTDQEAQKIDFTTAEVIKKMDPQELFLSCYGENRLCGAASVAAVMDAAKKLGANKAYVLKQANSGDTTQDKNRVVGYISAALLKEPLAQTENEKMDKFLTDQQKNKLLKISRDTITEYVSTGNTRPIKETDPVLNQIMGAFVTLHKAGQLRGCIGNIIGNRPLYLTVQDMAIASSSEDPRFAPVNKNELNQIDIEISVLSPLKKISNPDEIVLGKHGVLVKDGLRSGVYLPQVAAETGWTKEQFMDSLCQDKAGMKPDAWKTGKCEIYVFSAEVFGE